jgi:hypothetical protein
MAHTWLPLVPAAVTGRDAEPGVVYACCDDPTLDLGPDGSRSCSACGQTLTAAQVRALVCEHATVEAADSDRSRCPDCRLAFCQAVGSTGDGRTEPMVPDPCLQPATGVKGRWELCTYHQGRPRTDGAAAAPVPRSGAAGG